MLDDDDAEERPAKRQAVETGSDGADLPVEESSASDQGLSLPPAAGDGATPSDGPPSAAAGAGPLKEPTVLPAPRQSQEEVSAHINK